MTQATTKKICDIQAELRQFTGTENYYKHWLGNVYTDGVKYLAEKCQAYWLLDAIFSYHRKEQFQVWTLKVKDNKAVLEMREDTGEPIKVRQEIKYTDFPLEEIKLFLIDGVLLLTNEY